MTRKIVYPDAEESLAPLFTGVRLSKLEDLGELKIYYGDQPDEQTLIDRLVDADAVISGWGMNATAIAALPHLEVISFTGLGASTFIDIAEATRQKITVTHTTSAAETIAEHTMALMLDAARHMGCRMSMTPKGEEAAPLSEAEVSPLYLRQMAAYRAILTQIYPDRRLESYLLWTDGPRLMQLSDANLATYAP